MNWVGLVFWAGSLCQDCPTTFRFFIKSLEEGRLVRPKYRETSSRFCLCCFVIYVYIFVLDETAGFGCRHFIYKGYLKIWNQHVATLGWKPPLQSETTRLMESNLALWIRIRIILKTESCFLLCHKIMLSFAPVHMKTLKRWKYDSIPNRVGACVNARSIWCDIIVVENLRFLPSIRKRKAEVFKSLHSGDGFLKTAFLVPENAVYVEKEGYNGEKNPHQLSTTTGTPSSRVTIVVA